MGKSVKDAMTSNPCTIDAGQTVDQAARPPRRKQRAAKAGELRRVSPSGRWVDRSVQTDVRAKPAHPDDGIASDAVSARKS